MARSVNNVNYVQMKKNKIHEVFFFMFLSLIPTMVKGQVAEYNATTNWVYPGAQKYIGMDFINSNKGELVNNGTIIYKRNFTNNGTVKFVSTLSQTPALSEFSGTDQQHISGTGNTRFYSLLFDSKLVNNAFSLEQNIVVVNNVDFKNGVLVAQQTTPETPMNMLSLEASATAVNASDKGYMDGFVSKAGNTAFTFPIGNGGFYRPATIGATVSNTDNFSARYLFMNPDNKGYSSSSKEAAIYRVSSKEYWILNYTNGTLNSQLTLSWDRNKTSDRIPTNLRYLSIIRWNGTKWINEGNIATTGDDNQGTITANISGYGVFTLGMLVTALPVATDDHVTAYEDNDISVNVLANDTCSIGGTIKFNGFSIGGTVYQPGATVTIPNIGSLTASDKGVFNFVPVLNYAGTLPEILYTISDIDSNTATAKLDINVLQMPEVVKTATPPFLNSNGSFSWIYSISIQNDTPYDLDSIQVDDNLDAVLKTKNCTYTVTTVNATGGLTANGLYNGSNNIQTLIQGGKLQKNKTDTIQIEVNVDTHGQQDSVQVFNQAMFSAKASFGKIELKSDADITTSVADATRTNIPISTILVTEGFSPNGDGINDNYVIDHDASTKLDINIYNRTGYIIYHSSDYQNDWAGQGTGKFVGQDIPDGTYFCSYKAIKISTGEVVTSGTKFITIHR